MYQVSVILVLPMLFCAVANRVKYKVHETTHFFSNHCFLMNFVYLITKLDM